MSDNTNKSSIWYPAIAGFCVFFIGIGLCRFAYTPLITAIIHQAWASQVGAAWLGTINFLGYLSGALLGIRSTRYLNAPTTIKLSLVLSIVSLALSAIHWGFIWLAAWRFVAGITGAVLMVLTPSTILKKIDKPHRGRVAGIMFTGVGLGIVLAGLLFPHLVKWSVSIAWLSAALLSLIATLIAWRAFSSATEIPANSALISERNKVVRPYVIYYLTIAYALFAVGVVPHSLFLVDYVHRELQFNLVVSGWFWSIFGIGALVGPFLAGLLLDKIGSYKSLIVIFILACIGVPLLLFNKIAFLYVLSAFLAGALFPGIATLMSARLLELVGPECHAVRWGKMTLVFSIVQALGSAMMSYLLHIGFTYTGCFLLGTVALIISTVLIILAKEKNIGVVACQP